MDDQSEPQKMTTAKATAAIYEILAQLERDQQVIVTGIDLIEQTNMAEPSVERRLRIGIRRAPIPGRGWGGR